MYLSGYITTAYIIYLVTRKFSLNNILDINTVLFEILIEINFNIVKIKLK